MANEYKLRVHELDGISRERITAFLESIDGAIFCVRETEASRAHYQAFIRTDVKHQAFVKRLKKAFPECVGNKGYSLPSKQCDDWEGYVRYLCKGAGPAAPPDVVFQCTLDTINVRDLHAEFWRVNAELKAAARNNVKGFKDELLRRCRERVAGEEEYLMRGIIADEYLQLKQELGEANIDVYRARATVNGVWNLLCPAYAGQRLRDEILSRV